jgi:predicted acylesterase/phospholipase RssA
MFEAKTDSITFTTGGTVQAGKGIYLVRKADDELFALCSQSVFTHILTARQMGKSSLMVRTAERLKAEGVRTVTIDLTTLGVNVTAEAWYLGLLTEIGDRLTLDTNVAQWWRNYEYLGETHRLTRFFQEVLLAEITEPVVLFIDEIDTTLGLKFADDFFAAIRSLYLARAQNTEFSRLTFVLIGVATPDELMKDPRRTPFNIGERLELTDFSLAEALPLAEGFNSPPEQAKRTLEWVLKWTGGHPYLTQRLCYALANKDRGKAEEDRSAWTEEKVDGVVSETFFGLIERDTNLSFVQDMLTKRAPDVKDILSVYREIRLGSRPVRDIEQSITISFLKLSGVVRREGSNLQVRNRIYETVFDEQWITRYLPAETGDKKRAEGHLRPATRHESENIRLAKMIIAGQDADFDVMFALAKKLKNERAFSFARRILERIRRNKTEANHPDNRLKIAQQLALVTYKDPDLPPYEKLDSSFAILREADDLQTTTNQETLGLAGAIHKRRWEIDGQRQHLERSLAFYLRGYEQGIAGDYAYTGINAAFVLDLIAAQEEDDAGQANITLQSTADRRSKARQVREEITSTLEKMASEDPSLTRMWWFVVTIAEAYFGLEDYDNARKWMKVAAKLQGVPEWERESTIRQFAQLSRLLDRRADAADYGRRTKSWDALFDSLKEMYVDARVAEAACASAFTGRIGLALSGGGFRAALYHIGVLAKLAELDVLRKVEVLSCVSGGSIIGAHYYLEVRKLLQEKADRQITKEDYIEIVKRVERDFLAGVQTNIRTSVVANPFVNLRMIFSSNYSRTTRVGELYEKRIFSRVEDGEGARPRWLNDLQIRPIGERINFHPKNDNWRRVAKVPILILNATTLNTGHNWQFTTTWMGEPPSSIDSEIDGNYRLRRMYYEDAPEGHRRVRLGHAVAASSCVPALFEPLALTNLYYGLVVRLVDGGVYDNQGTASLLDQGCNILLVSDASGQMNTENNPGGGLLSVPLRTNSVLQARVRVAQYRELSAQRRASILRGLMFIHLKKDLPVKPMDWIDCPDPQDSFAPDLPVTKYGINKGVQERLAAIRTDLDSFSDAEARALMISGYRMAESEMRRSLPELDQLDGAAMDWQFMKFDELLTRADISPSILGLLSAASSLAFKIWRLSRPLQASSIILGTILVGFFNWYCWENWNTPIVSFGFGGPDESLWRLTWGDTALTVITIAALSLLPAFARSVLRLIDYRKTAYEITVGIVMGLLGWIAAQLHLLVFDKLYLWWGSQKRLLGTRDNRSNE